MRPITLAVLFLAALLVGPVIVGVKKNHPAIPAAAPEGDVKVGDKVLRSDLRFSCGQTQCAGWLFLPVGAEAPPVVIMGHGFGGTRDVALPYFAEYAARQGIAAFVFDYRNFGSSGGSPRQLVDVAAQLEDWDSAINFISGVGKVDVTRIALWGSSLGGGHALITAARSPSVTAVIGMVPLIDPRIEGEAVKMDAISIIRLLAKAWGGLWVSAFGLPPLQMPSIGPSGTGAMIADDAADRTVRAFAGDSRTYENTVVAYSIFLFDDYNPAIQAAGLTRPALLIASRADRFAAFVTAETFVAQHPERRIAEVACDHFEVYTDPCRADAAAAATAFLRETFKLDNAPGGP